MSYTLISQVMESTMKTFNTTKEVTMTPQYLHDCESCTFLGQHGSADLYACNQFDCIIVRYSSQDSDNVAYRWDIIERFGLDSIDNLDVLEAYRRAVRLQKELASN